MCIAGLPTVATLEQAGYYGVDVGTPYSKTRFSQRGNWQHGKYALSYNWRYIGGSSEQPGGTTYVSALPTRIAAAAARSSTP